MHRYFRKMRAPSFINYVRGPPSLINVSQSDASIPRLFLARLHGSVTHGTSIPRRRNKSASSRGWRCRLPRNQFEATLTRSIIGSRTRATNSRIKLLWRCQGRLWCIFVSREEILYIIILLYYTLLTKKPFQQLLIGDWTIHRIAPNVWNRGKRSVRDDVRWWQVRWKWHDTRNWNRRDRDYQSPL